MAETARVEGNESREEMYVIGFKRVVILVKSTRLRVVQKINNICSDSKLIESE